ncbi:ABC transporter ATP-binding protein [candidate division KSB1 bacterium]|nr:ABC transporter ATP-binding protein [candidate division KSB1 bacterium]
MGKAYDSRLMKRLLTYMKPYRWQVVLAVLLMLVATALDLLMPYLTKIALDNYIIPHDAQGLLHIVWLFIWVLVFQFFFQISQAYLLQWIGQKVLYDLRIKLFRHMQRLSLSFFDKNPVGRLVTRVTTDVETLNELFSAGIVAIFGDIFLLAGIIIVLLKINSTLALITFSVLPVLFYITIVFRKYVREGFRQIRVRIAKINAYLQENISGMLIVQLFNREKKNFKKFDVLNADHLEAYIRTIVYFAIFFPAVELISAIAVALIVWYGGMNFNSGAVTIGTLVAFIQYARRFFRPISDLSEKYNILQAAMASSERIFKILDTVPDIKNPEAPWEVINFRGHIEFDHVWFSYKKDEEDWVLRDVSFQVLPGEKIAFVGATGAGKTTIISLLCRFYDVQRGSITIDGVDIREYDIHFLRSHFGIVLQDVFLFAGDIETNIRLSNTAMPREQIIKAAKDVNLDPFIRQLPNQYQEEVKERGSTLSMGQRQLLSFARALASNPHILILDEATSSVDTETELLIQDALKTLMEGRTSIIIAHRLSTIVNSDRILVMHKGKIRETGTHRELLTQKGIYHRLYQLQYKGENQVSS